MAALHFRPRLEALEDRLMLSSSPVSTVPKPVLAPAQAAPQAGTYPSSPPGGVALGSDGLPVTWSDSMASLQKTISEIKGLVDRQKAGDTTVTNKVIADRLSQIIDQRITNTNDQSARNEEAAVSDDLAAWFNANRESLGGRFSSKVANNTIGDEYALRAEWAWDLGLGRCDETAAIAYYVLKEAGRQDVIRLSHDDQGIGHAFVVLGFQPNVQDPDYPRVPETWGPHACVVDGWQGRSFTVDEAVANRFISDYGNNNITVVDTEDNAKNYQLNKKFVQGRSFASKTEEALEIVRARNAFAHTGLNLEVQAKPTESGELISGKAIVRLGKDFVAKLQTAKQPMQIEVLLSKDGSIIGRQVVLFHKGEYTKELALEHSFPGYAPMPTRSTSLQLSARELSSNPRLCTPQFRSVFLSVKALAPRSDLEVHVVDDVTGQTIGDVRVGVHRPLFTIPVSTGSTSDKGYVFKDLLTKDPAYLTAPTIGTAARFSYVVDAGKDGYVAASSAPIAAAPAGQKQVVTIRLVRAVNVHLKVLSSDGTPSGGWGDGAPKLTVAGSGQLFTAAFNSVGDLVFNNVPATKDGQPLTYTITSSYPNYAPATVTYKFDGQNTEPVVTMQLHLALTPSLDVTGVWKLADMQTQDGYGAWIRIQETLTLHADYTQDKDGGIASAVIGGDVQITYTWTDSLGNSHGPLILYETVTGTLRDWGYNGRPDITLQFSTDNPVGTLADTQMQYGGQATWTTWCYRSLPGDTLCGYGEFQGGVPRLGSAAGPA